MQTELVFFRLIVCPHCEHAFCWVNPRLPNYCPECGKNVVATVKSSIRWSHDAAELVFREE